MKLAVIFPGVGYHVDKPLLYYSRKIVLERGYEVVNVPYGNFSSDIKGSPEKMEEAFYNVLGQAEEILSDVNFAQYEEVLFISKSIGTAVASAYAEKHGLKTRNIYYTPVEASFQFMKQPGIVFHGTNDTWIETELIQKECERYGFPLYITEKANHSMEKGNTEQDLKHLIMIMEITKMYIEEDHVHKDDRSL